MSAIFKTPEGAARVRGRYAAFLQHWPVPSRQRRIPTRLGETFVVESGPKDAPAAILLHGSASNSATWIGDAALWAQRMRLFAVDLPGEPGLSTEARPTLASGAYVGWLDEVLAGLGLTRAAVVGISLGGWMALDYATRRPERVAALALLCPGGVGRRRNVLLWATPLLLLGPWGRGKVTERIRGPKPPGEPSPAAQAFGAFMQLIFTHFRPRTERLPSISDTALGRLAMPVLVILGGKDVFIDSAGTRERLCRLVPQAQIRFLPEAGHFLAGQTGPIGEFLAGALGL